MDLVGLRLAPALTGGLIVALHAGAAGEGALVFAAMMLASQLVERSRLPLHLMPAARIAVGMLTPMVGAAGVLAAATLVGGGAAIGGLTSAVLGAWLVLGLGAWMKTRLDESAKVRVAVIGSPRYAADLRAELAEMAVAAYDVVGWLGPEGPYSRHGRGPDWLGALDQVRGAVLVHRVDLIVTAPDRESGPGGGPDAGPWGRVADSCLDLPVRMIGANQFYEELLGHVPIGTIDQAWYRYVLHPRFQLVEPLSKRVLDLILASALALVLAPLMAIAAIAVRLGDGGPALYRQQRLGEHGEEFEILKLRTMTQAAEGDGRARWAAADDDRITRVGRVLRRSHVDELPQLWNVLRGDMTLVGPRPERPEMVSELERRYSHYTRRHLLKPGIAGWAQLRCGYAGSEVGTAWKLCHDLYYIKHRTVIGDLLILFETAFVTFRDAHRALRTPRERFLFEQRAHG